MPSSLTAVLGILTLFTSWIIAAVSAAYVVGKGTHTYATKIDLDNFIKIINTKVDLAREECGIAIESIQGRVSELDKITSVAAVKVDTMWAFQMRRAMSEVVEKGLGTMGSPLHFTQTAYDALAPIRQRLIDFYGNLPHNKCDAEILLDIEKNFGDELLDLVCLPCKLTHGACLMLAYAMAKQTTELEIHL